jgi:hypothetical protein
MLPMANATRARISRLCSLLVLLFFTGAGVGLPMLDAVRYHGRGEHMNGRDHYDPAGGCRDHAENCVLVFTGATDRAAPPPIPAVRLAMPAVPLPSIAVSATLSSSTPLLLRSRAPPAILA